jgi:integrase/recombinase XerD
VITVFSLKRLKRHHRLDFYFSDRSKGIRLHDLRHTYATERVQLISLEELRALMGHDNIQTTLHYQKVTSQKAEEAAQKALQLLHK